MVEFYCLKMKDIEIIGDFVGKLFEISFKVVVLGDNIKEFKLVKKLFFQIKYIYIVVFLEQVFDYKIIIFGYYWMF